MTELAATPTRATAAALDQRLVDVALAVLVGGSAFWLIVGPRVLDVTNIAWLAHTYDSFQHYIGWEFFRRSPWTWPPGLNPTFGLEFSSSIIFTDSMPLIPMVLKLFSPLMPAVFQYTGWWVLACFLLQAWFVVRIAGLVSQDTLIKLALAVLLVFAPPMLWRLSIHYSLVSHWVILAAIYLYFAPSNRLRSLQWVALLAASSLIHTYVFPMVIPIWLASLVRRRIARDTTSTHPLIELVAGFGAPAIALALGGFFPLRHDMLGGGYGHYRLNLLSMINPDGGMYPAHWSWSAFLPNIPQDDALYEGFAYGGLGVLAALALALPLLVTNRAALTGHRIWPLVIAAILLTLFAISPNIAIADRGIFIPFPEALMDLAGAMRSSGRFFWPVWYLLPLGAVWLIHRSFGHRPIAVVLVLLAALQVYDTSPGWSSLRPIFDVTGSTYPTSIDDSELDAVVSHYNAVRMLPAANQADNWRQVAWFALRNGKPTDAAYLARPDVEGYAAYMAGIDAVIAAHSLDANALYLTDRDYAQRIARHMTADDAMFQVGNFYVFAPGWTRFGTATALTPVQPASPW